MQTRAWGHLFVTVAGLTAMAFLLVFSANGTGTDKVNYARPFETPTRPAFIALPPGAVEPAGWLRDWCMTMRDGFTSCMDDVDPAFRQAWAADYKMTGESLFWMNGGWPYEGGSYWFDGLARLGYALRDEALIKQAKARFDAVIKNANERSILYMWWLDRNSPVDVTAAEGRNHPDSEWPMWVNGTFGRSVAGYYAASRDKLTLNAMENAYSGESRWLRMGFAPTNVWPAFETYTWTGNPKIKAALDEVFQKGSENKGRWSWDRYGKMPEESPWAQNADHGVHAMESTPAWALGYLWTGNREFLDVALQWHALLSGPAMQPHGVPVSDEFYGPTGAARLSETCSVMAFIWSQTTLLTISGQGYLGDQVERAFFNAAPNVVSRDCRSHVYLQPPNRTAPGEPQSTYQRKHSPLCCTAALNRILPYYITNMWMATYDNGLAATFYGPCTAYALVANHVPLRLACRTEYPFDKTLDISVDPEREATFPLSFRIPGWCASPTLTVNEINVENRPDANGFVRVERIWKKGDVVSLRFPMSPRVVAGVDRNPYGELQRNTHVPPAATGQAPYATVSYGPLLFVLPIADTQDANTPDPTAEWRFALETVAEKPGNDAKAERSPMPAKWDWPLDSPLKLHAKAVAFDWKPDDRAPLPSQPISAKGAVTREISLIPYGCAKFRVSMFPVTEQTWKVLGDGM